MPNHTTPVTGPHRIHVTAIPGGAELDVTAYLRHVLHDALAILTGELRDDFDAAADQTPGDPHAIERPQDMPFEQLIETLVERVGVPLPVYGPQVAALSYALVEVFAPKGLPSQRGAA